MKLKNFQNKKFHFFSKINLEIGKNCKFEKITKRIKCSKLKCSTLMCLYENFIIPFFLKCLKKIQGDKIWVVFGNIKN